MKGGSRAQLWRFGGVALFCGLPLLLLALILGNLAEASSAREVAARQEATLSQIIKQVARHKAQGLSIEDTAALYLPTASPSLARADLQGRTGRLVEAAGGRLVEAQFTSSAEQEAEGTVAIQLSLDIDNKGLFDLVYAVETSVPLLDATDLNARPAGKTAEEGAPGAPGLLHVDLTVQGHFVKAAG